MSQQLSVFQTAVTAKNICKSSLGQLLATDFDIAVKSCFPFSTFARLQLAPSAACMKICVVSNKTHEKRTTALTVRVRSSVLLVPQSLINYGRNGNSHFDGCRPPREVYAEMCVMRCAVQIQNTQGTLLNFMPERELVTFFTIPELSAL